MKGTVMAKKTQDNPVESVDPRIEELTNDLQRIQADFVNFKRRAEQEKGELLDFAKSRVVRDFLSVRDNFDREVANRPTGIDASWAASIDSIRASFDTVLKNLGVERFESAGQPFDPHMHDAIVMEEGEGAHEVVTEEMQSGYKLGDTVLRHAIVKVGRTDDAPIDIKEESK
jgi:molecular chaperone GrpE